MRQLDREASRGVRDAMRFFLRSEITGCRFARALATEERHISYGVIAGQPDDDLPDQLDAVIDAAAATEELAVLIFPEQRGAHGIVELLTCLAAGRRWSIKKLPWQEHQREGVLIGVEWRTPQDEWSSVLGMAPLGQMPVVRRAPYVSMALWPGPRSNPHRGQSDKVISIGDMPPPQQLDRAGYRKMFQDTRDLVQRLLAYPPEGAARHDVTFCLPEAEAEPLLGALGTEGLDE